MARLIFPRPGLGRRIAVSAVALGLAGSLIQRAAPPAVAFGDGDVTPPSLWAAQWTGPNTPVHEILLLWDDILDQSATPDFADFEVELDGAPLTEDGVAFTHAGFVDPDLAVTFMTLHLADPVIASGGTLTVSYVPGAIPVMDEAGNEAGPVTDLAVEVFEYGSFEAVMVLVDGSYGRDHIGLLFADAVDPITIPPTSAFEVIRNGTPMTPISISIFPGFGGRILDLLVPVGFRSGDVATISYTAPVGGGIKNLMGTPAPNFADADVLLALVARDSVSGATGAGGGSVTSDAGDPGTTAQDPVATTIFVPAEATVLIDEGAAEYPPSVPEYTFIGETVEIVVSPPATAANPIVIDFAIDASVLTAAGVTGQTVQLLRNSVPVAVCTGAPGTAVPIDPCIESRTAVPAAPDPLEYAVLRVNTSAASTWNFAVRTPFPWAGFRAPVNNPPTVNVGLGGLAIPVRFTLGGDQGMAIFALGYPVSERIPCPSGVAKDILELMLPAAGSSLHYGPRTGVYTYVWRTERAWSRAPAGPCRRLTLGFVDGTFHEAIFRFR